MKRLRVLLVSFALVFAMTVTFGVAAVELGARAGWLPAIAWGKIDRGLWQELSADPAAGLPVLIETRSLDYAAVAQDVLAAGGRIVHEYRFVTGLAAVVPGTALLRLAANPDVLSIESDAIVSLDLGDADGLTPQALERRAGTAIPLGEEFQVLDVGLEGGADLAPSTFISTVTHGAAPLIAEGIDGRESIAAIIDTGIYSGHFMLRGKVVGGVDVSPDAGTGFEGFDDIRNHWHGSAVAGTLGGFARLLVSNASLVVRSVELHSGMPLPDGPVPGTKVLTLSGIAPASKFFVVKVFPHSGAGVPSSVVIRGLEAAMEAKASGRFDIDIISMSLGGPTLFDGRGLDAQAVSRATATGIVVSIAAGNEGPAPMSVADPGASGPAITSAALIHPINTRVSWDLFFGRLGIGSDLFVSDTPQIHAFSSRGPTADGRAKPDVAALGVDNLAPLPLITNRGQGLAFVAGTSFATPTTSGILALLNDFVEREMEMPDGATPEDLKQAVIDGAGPIPGYAAEEQGAGFVNASAALDALQGAQLGKVAPALPEIPQGTPLEDLADIRNLFLDVPADTATRTFTTELTLGPGENREFVFETVAGTDSVVISLSDVDVGENPNSVAQAAFPNSLEVYIHDAKRGGSGLGYYVYSANVLGNATFTIREGRTSIAGAVSVFPSDVVRSVIEPGFSKVVVEGDWSNAVPVRANLTIEVTFEEPPEPALRVRGEVGQFNFTSGRGLVVLGPYRMPRGTVLKLSWSPGDYAHFPSSDVDFLLAKGPTFATITNAGGASLDSPERTVVTDDGRFFVLVLGFEINPEGATETFVFEAFAP